MAYGSHIFLEKCRQRDTPQNGVNGNRVLLPIHVCWSPDLTPSHVRVLSEDRVLVPIPIHHRPKNHSFLCRHPNLSQAVIIPTEKLLRLWITI